MRILLKICIIIISTLSKFNVKVYMSLYTFILCKLGVKIAKYDGTGYIDPTCYIDGSDYSYICIGKHVTISRNATLLTHDFSIGKGLSSIGAGNVKNRHKFLKGITIGDETFIGLNVIVLPGTVIGKYCIIGSGTVVKGYIPDYSICIGNPSCVVGDVRVWAKSHIEKKDFTI